MSFDTKKIYTEKLSLHFGRLNPKTLAELFSDGRASAFPIYEHLIAKHGFKRASDPDNPADCVLLSNGRMAQVRLVTQHGIFVNRHKQNGLGRRFNKAEHRRQRAVIAGYIFVDVTRMPVITYAFAHLLRVPEGIKLSADIAKGIITLAPLPDPE